MIHTSRSPFALVAALCLQRELPTKTQHRAVTAATLPRVVLTGPMSHPQRFSVTRTLYFKATSTLH